VKRGRGRSHRSRSSRRSGAKETATLLPQHLRPRNCARATRKERMYVGYYFKDGLGHDKKAGRTEEELMMHEDFVQIHDVSSPPEKEVVKHGKPY
jgi:hypothetical protein